MKIIEASISEKGDKVFILVEWKSEQNGKTFRTSETVLALDIVRGYRGTRHEAEKK